MQLYKSGHFALTEIRRSGKKDTAGILCFEGLPSVFGSKKEVLALEDGVVLRAGRCTDLKSRDHRLGTFVAIGGRNGVSIIYGRLACRFVRNGDYVKAGTCIGIEGSSGSGSGEFLTLEFRKNGRRVDGCEYLGISHMPQEFNPPESSAAEIVCRACSLDEPTRRYLDAAPDSDRLWNSIASHLEISEAASSEIERRTID
ncbi:MAG TPA: M23 family metallopeptidase [Firmicutes bacterium]|nr:M23 family metallopeptidase [Bacillota bacterium]